MKSYPLVLTSSSPTRKAQLARFTQAFETWSPNIDESPLAGEDPVDMVKRLAIEKAKAGEARFPAHILIAGDQVQTIEGEVFGKPHTHANAITQLEKASGKTTAFHAGLCVLNTATQKCLSTVTTIYVTFKPLTREHIESYLTIDEPYQCAGSIKAEGIGLALMEKVECPDPSALLGLPLITLASMLELVGYQLLPR